MSEIRRDGRLSGRVAIVTGAGSRTSGIGNGRAASILLARHGAKVVLIDAILEAAEETRGMIAGEARASIPSSDGKPV